MISNIISTTLQNVSSNVKTFVANLMSSQNNNVIQQDEEDVIIGSDTAPQAKTSKDKRKLTYEEKVLKKARLKTNMDTLPDEIYQHIFGYALGDYVNQIFHNASWHCGYRLQYVNKTFQRNFRSYIKTSPLHLFIGEFKYYLQLINVLKTLRASGIYLLQLEIGYYDDKFAHDIIKALNGINVTSVRELLLMNGVEFIDYEKLKECKELTSITLGREYSADLDEIEIEKLRTFLSFHKHTVESLVLDLGDDIFPNDLVSWPKLNELIIYDTGMASKSTVIESSTLQELWIFLCSSCDMVIKCPNLEELYIVNKNLRDSNDDIELEKRPRQPYDDHHDEEFKFTCHPSELRKFGIEAVEISSHCDIGIDMSYVYRRRRRQNHP